MTEGFPLIPIGEAVGSFRGRHHVIVLRSASSPFLNRRKALIFEFAVRCFAGHGQSKL